MNKFPVESDEHGFRGGENDEREIVQDQPSAWLLVKEKWNQMLTCVRHVCGSHDPPDLLHWLEVGAEATVATKDLLVHDGGDGQTVKTVRESLPQLDVETPFA